MATSAQILANQANAQRSTGPVTEEGKATSARNATTHGLSSAFAVLENENQAEFTALVEALREENQPVNHHQSFLVLQMAQSRWLLARARRLETVAFDIFASADTIELGDAD